MNLSSFVSLGSPGQAEKMVRFTTLDISSQFYGCLSCKPSNIMMGLSSSGVCVFVDFFFQGGNHSHAQPSINNETKWIIIHSRLPIPICTTHHLLDRKKPNWRVVHVFQSRTFPNGDLPNWLWLSEKFPGQNIFWFFPAWHVPLKIRKVENP